MPDHPRAQQLFAGMTLSEAQRADCFAWAIAQPPNASDDYLFESFQDMARRRGISFEELTQ